jgi:uncharacterized membrane protein HdeD (DUF308 family)
MILDAITKLKRQSIMTAILLLCLGVVLLLCPEEYVSTLIIVSGYIMIVYCLEQVLEFLVARNTLMSYITFCIAILVGLVGLAVLVFHEDILSVLSWIFGLVLILDGGHSIYYGCTFARRSGRNGWSVFVIVSSVLVLAGILLIAGEIYFSHAVFKTPVFLMKLIGVAVIFSALVNFMKIIWVWPVKNGGDEDAGE